MKQIYRVKGKFLNEEIEVIFSSKGIGLLVEIIGPNDHLGGAGLGTPYTRRNGKPSASSNSWSLYKHRDGDSAAELARIIAKITRIPTLVFMGLTFKDAKKEEIEDFRKFINEIVSEACFHLPSNFSDI